MGHQHIFDQIVLRKYLPKVKAFKERWNHRDHDTFAPISNVYDLGEEDYSRFTDALRYYKENSRPMIYEIVISLLQEYGVVFKELPINGDNLNVYSAVDDPNPLWFSKGPIKPFMKCIIVDVQNIKFLLAFRDFGIHNRISQEGLTRIHERYPFDGYFSVSFVYEKAYEEVINHNDNEGDMTRGTQSMSLKDFFLYFFDPSEYDLFCSYMERYKKEVIEYLGITVSRTLQPNAIPGFKKDLIDSIIKNDYYSALNSICPNNAPARNLVQKISDQFIQADHYKALIGRSKFAISLLTAEWLYVTLHNIVTIDQTPIILGYFKAIEQLLFDYVSFQAVSSKANKLKTIKISNNSTPEILTESLITTRGRYMTLGTFTSFLAYRGNFDLIRNDLRSDPSLNAESFISEFLRSLPELRNEYLHRENIDNWQIVEKTRQTAFSLFFIILGAYVYDTNEKESIDIVSVPSSNSNMILLCEYIHKKAVEEHDMFELPVFYINHNYTQPLWPDPDWGITYDKYGTISYSGIHFHSAKIFDTKELVDLSFSSDKIKALTIEEDIYVINQDNPMNSHLKNDRKIIYENEVLTPYK